MQNPVVKVFEEGLTIAELNANEAYLNSSSNHIELLGGVRVIDAVNDSLLLTEKLLLDTIQKQAFSRQTVKILSPDSSTTALGIQGNLTDQRWQLLSDVQSTITVH